MLLDLKKSIKSLLYQSIEELFILGLAKQLMDGLEVLSDKKNCYFVDLFVRVSNKATHQSSISEYLFNLLC
jgi:hypothetical protein